MGCERERESWNEYFNCVRMETESFVRRSGCTKTHFHKMANENEPESMKWNAFKMQNTRCETQETLGPSDMMEMNKIPELTENYFERRDDNPLEIANPTQKSRHSVANISLGTVEHDREISHESLQMLAIHFSQKKIIIVFFCLVSHATMTTMSTTNATSPKTKVSFFAFAATFSVPRPTATGKKGRKRS